MSKQHSMPALPERTSREKAELLIKRLMGSYPSLTVHDPKTYTVELITILMQYPPSVSEYGMTEARRASPQFLPTIAQIEMACDEYFKNTTHAEIYADQWETQAEKQIREREEFEQENSEPLEQRRVAAERIMRELAEAFADNSRIPYNVFVPTFAPQYADMVKRGGRPGVSVEDENRTGVWVQHNWLLQGSAHAKETWKQFTPDELQFLYAKKDI